VCGVVGSGKSTVARALAERVAGVVISSDRTRKHLAGVSPEDRAGAREGEAGGIYDSEHIDAAYEGLLERAAPVVDSGRVAVLDATFSRARHRQHTQRWAEERGVAATLFEARCEESVALARLARREAEERDPSDAGPDFYPISVRNFEAPDEWPAHAHHEVQTDSPVWRKRLTRQVRESAKRAT
jgi:hypothetical protein